MQLFLSDTSPYARKVLILLKLLGVSGKTEVVSVRPFENPPELLAVNPLCRVPTLVIDNGTALPDSSLITDYLLTEYDGSALLPREGDTRWEILRLAGLAEGVMDLSVVVVQERRKPEGMVHGETIDRRVEQIMRTITYLDGSDWQLSSDRPTVFEITLACALSFLDFRLRDLDWRAAAPGAAAWYATIESLAWMQETAPVG